MRPLQLLAPIVLLFWAAAGVAGEPQRQRARLVTPYERYRFEGVDATEMPDSFRNAFNDCHAAFSTCYRDTKLSGVVCVYNKKTFKFEDKDDICLVELHHCIKGSSAIIYYNGEGEDCWAYTRRSSTFGDLMRNYFRRESDLGERYLHGMDEAKRKGPPVYTRAVRGPRGPRGRGQRKPRPAAAAAEWTTRKPDLFDVYLRLLNKPPAILAELDNRTFT